MFNNRLTVGQCKIETILLIGMRIPKLINIMIDNYNLKKRGMLIKRLGIEIDSSRKVITHIEGIYTRVDAATRNLPLNLNEHVRTTEADTTGMVKMATGNWKTKEELVTL
jgi:hypothetical protein